VSARAAIVVLAKVPRPGLVKTRLCPPLCSQEAAELYEHMLDDVLAATDAFAQELDLDPILAVHPAEGAPELLSRAPRRFRVIAQRGRDLAERMTWAGLEAAAGGLAPILLRGSDSPVLDQERVHQVLSSLDGHDLAICPDLDGGYSLVGMRRPVAGIFGHRMSTGSVLEDTLACAEALGLRCQLTTSSFDVDTVDDLATLARARRAGDTALCPRTIAFLDDRDLWRHAGTAGRAAPALHRADS
jgi:rSAM/selenodomain-associated transferase 1